jgi:hypothetical protein
MSWAVLGRHVPAALLNGKSLYQELINFAAALHAIKV